MFTLLFLAKAQPHIERSKYVEELSDDTWKKNIEQRDNSTTWFVLFFGDFCPACRQAAPMFNEAAKQLNGYIKFGSIDTTRYSVAAFEYKIKYLPTFIIFHSDGFDYYSGGRSVEHFVDALSPFYEGCLTDINTELDLIEGNTALMFSLKKVSPLYWKTLSCKLKDVAKLGYSTNPSLKIKFNLFSPSGIIMHNKTNTVVLNNLKNFSQNVISFYEGKYQEELPSPKLYLPSELVSQCREPVKLCVCINSDRIDSELSKHISNFAGKPIKFFQGNSRWPIDAISNSIYSILSNDLKNYIAANETSELFANLNQCLFKYNSCPFTPIQ